MQSQTVSSAGFKVAVYSVRGQGGYFGFARICPPEADDPWDCVPLELLGYGPCAFPETSLMAVEQEAHRACAGYASQRQLQGT